jgi:hypothetical protein
LGLERIISNLKSNYNGKTMDSPFENAHKQHSCQGDYFSFHDIESKNEPFASVIIGLCAVSHGFFLILPLN